jgi:hypothetical protein
MAKGALSKRCCKNHEGSPMKILQSHVEKLGQENIGKNTALKTA